MNTRLYLLLLTLVLAAISITAPAADANPPALFSSELSGKDLGFLMTAANAAIIQSNIGGMAKARGASEAVKLVGEAVATSHATSKTELQTLAAKKGVPVSTTPNKEQIALIDKISKLASPAFDQACMEEIVRQLQAEVAQFESAAQSQDADVKAFAVKLLPQLREHFLLAKKIAAMAAQPAPAFRGTVPERK